jgi:hypothetical protein
MKERSACGGGSPGRKSFFPENERKVALASKLFDDQDP